MTPTNTLADALKQCRDALAAMLTHMGMDEDECNKVTFDQARAAVKAADSAPALMTADDVAEALRKRFVKLPRFSFHLDNRGNIRRVEDKYGNWVEFEQAHTLFDPVCVDAALAAADAAMVQAVPLTEEQIDAMWEAEKQASADRSLKRQWVRFARAIERAHNITGGSNG